MLEAIFIVWLACWMVTGRSCWQSYYFRP